MSRLAIRMCLSRSARLACLVLLAASPAWAAEGGLQLLPNPVVLGGLLLTFVVIVAPLNALLFRPVIRSLDERDERIAGTRAKAERLAEETQEVLERYEGAIREARASAETDRRQRIDEARTRMLETTANARSAAEGELERARGELGTTLEEARGSLRTQASELAREAAASVLGRAV